LEIIKTLLLGVVEGVTEFLPVSSTGHLILMERLFTLSGGPGFRETFMIVIQLPVILAVALYFRRRLWPFHKGADTRKTCALWFRIMVAFLPAAALGALFSDVIERYLFGPTSVAAALVIGGVVILCVEHAKPATRYDNANDITLQTALCIGIFQCLSLIPGASRSAATIVGAMLLGANRHAAAEFSFFLAIPTMLGATTFKIVTSGTALDGREWALIALGGFVSFLTAYLVIAAFMNYIRHRSFRPFGWYRIGLGVLILLMTFL